jgi:small subunit ribosomal protein S6
MSRKYEIVYIFDSAMEEAQITESLDRFHALLKNQDYPEPITATNHWGKRTLAYPINKKEQGYYVVAQFESDQKLLNEFERAIKLDVNVLRYLVVINEGLATAPVIPERAESEYDKRDAGRPKKRAEDGDKAETPAEDADKPETPAEDADKPETPAEDAGKPETPAEVAE